MIKRCFGLILAAAMLTAAAGASAAPALSPEEVIEQVAVPMAQKNDDANYSNDELKELITVLNGNGRRCVKSVSLFSDPMKRRGPLISGTATAKSWSPSVHSV